MAQLHELLREDQEPFLLKSYIADKRGQLKRPSPPKTQLQIKKRSRPISEVSNFPINLCRKACFFSLQDSPDLKSPLFEFSSPGKSPCKSPNAIFLHIPTRTAALLVEAAMRIQKQSNSAKPKSQNQTKHNGFGLIGSFLKRLKSRAHKRDQMIQIEKEGTSTKISSEASKDLMSFGCSGSMSLEEQSGCEMCVGSSSNVNSGPGTCEVWSTTLEMETSTSTSQSEAVLGTSTDCVCCQDKLFCESPFRFVLETTSPSPSGSRTPEFTSPATSPARHKLEEKEGSKCFQNEEEEEDKEQCSPVSVLDPPLEDDDEEHDEEDDEHGFDMECSYAIMQRTKKQLMQKLLRFEKLAELDPIELEKRMSEKYDDDDEDYKSIGDEEAESEECDDEESRTSESSSREVNLDGCVREILSKSRFPSSKRTGQDVKRLVSDLVVEEHGEENDGFSNGEELTRRVCKRFSSWNEVKSNTIDMMVDQDFRVDLSSWKQNQDQVEETAEEVELAIFCLLVEELAMELAC